MILLALSGLGCSGMTGLAGAPGGGGFADSNTSSRDSSSDNSKVTVDNSLEAKDGNSNNDPGLVGGVDPMIAGAVPGSGPPTTIASKSAPAQSAAAGDPLSGYRPGQEGQVQMGPNVRVAVSNLKGSTNCKRPDGQAWDTLFTGTDTPMVYLWLGEGPQGPYAPMAQLKSANEYGVTTFTCLGDAESDHPEEYPYALFLATFLDSKGVQHQTEKLSVPCPSIKKKESGEFCLNFPLPAPAMMARPVDATGNGALIRKTLPSIQDPDSD